MSITFYTGSEKYGTSIMKDIEVLLFTEAALENGSDVSEAIQDMKMIDSLLYAHRLQKVCGPVTSRTVAGNFRRNSTYGKTMDRIIQGRIEGAFDY